MSEIVEPQIDFDFETSYEIVEPHVPEISEESPILNNILKSAYFSTTYEESKAILEERRECLYKDDPSITSVVKGLYLKTFKGKEIDHSGPVEIYPICLHRANSMEIFGVFLVGSVVKGKIRYITIDFEKVGADDGYMELVKRDPFFWII